VIEYLIIANSARALAESAVQTGYKVIVADYFADDDTKSISDSVHQLQYSDEGFNAEELISFVNEIIARHPDIKLVIGSGFESNTELVERLDQMLTVFANTKETIALLKKPVSFFSVLDKYSIQYPEVSLSRPKASEAYLIKGVASIGGRNVNWADKSNQELKSEHYYQQYIPGNVMSAVFLANGHNANVIGFNRQLQLNQFEKSPFLYQGAISRDRKTVLERKEIESIVNNITKESGLKGLCGIDYILDKENKVYVLEVNPRPPGTFELHKGRQSMFDAHLAAFKGTLLEINSNDDFCLRGYAVLYAKEKRFISDKIDWPLWVKDRPGVDNVIEETMPVCTVHAEENSIDKVKTMLFNRLQEIESIIAATQNAA